MASSAGALSSSRRRALHNKGGDSMRSGSMRNLGNSKRGSMRNLGESKTRMPQAPGLSYSLGSLHGDGPKIDNPLDSSVSTMPELTYLRRETSDGDGSCPGAIEMRHRHHPQNAEQGPNGTPSTSDGVKKKSRSSSLNQDDFVDNDSKDSSPSITSRLPQWMHTVFKPFNDARKFIGKVVNDDRVQNTVLILITINAIMMGIATFPVVKNDPDLSNKFEIADEAFLILFTVESGMQVLFHGWKVFKDGFLVFDLAIVVMSWALEGTQVIRAFRIFRALRLITRIDTMKNLVLALLSVIPKMTAIGMLLLLIFYIFAVMFTQLFKGMYEDGLVSQPYFSGLGYSLFTLFQMMTLDEWAYIQYQVGMTYSWSWVPFLMFIVITGFVVVNLIIAVICDAVHVMGGDDKAGLLGEDDSSKGDEDSAIHPNNNYTEDQLPTVMESNSFQGHNIMNNAARQKRPAEQRLQDLQQKLDEMVMVQDQMRRTIQALTLKLKENAGKNKSPAIPSLTSTNDLRPVS